MHRTLKLMAVVALLAAVPPAAPTAAAEVDPPGPPPDHTTTEEPFANWNVVIQRDHDDPHLVEVSFDSEAVGQRTTSLVWLPSRYHDSPDPFPVTYYLHGQVDTATMGAGPALSDASVPLPYPFAPGSSRDFGGIDPPGTAAIRDFLLVGVDNGPRSWCGHCWYTDGVGDQGVDAERHLLQELIPLIEHLFRVRTDRGGRAVLGNSMGANGALLIGFRHPDVFAFAGGLSPTYAGVQEKPLWEAWAHSIWSLYTIDQGWGPPATEEIRYHALDPLNLAPNVLGTDLEIITVIGDGCVPNDGTGACASEPATGDPDQELLFRRVMDIWTTELTGRGVRFTDIKREGAHSANLNRASFRQWFLPRMNDVFARSVAEPRTFSYTSIDPAFDIWGWSFSVDRPNLERLHILGTATDGSELTLAGTGRVRVTTPPLDHPGRPTHYAVSITPDGGETTLLLVTPDAGRRVSFEVDLGPPRPVNETRALVESGQYQFPHTRVTVAPEDPGRP